MSPEPKETNLTEIQASLRSDYDSMVKMLENTNVMTQSTNDLTTGFINVCSNTFANLGDRLERYMNIADKSGINQSLSTKRETQRQNLLTRIIINLSENTPLDDEQEDDEQKKENLRKDLLEKYKSENIRSLELIATSLGINAVEIEDQATQDIKLERKTQIGSVTKVRISLASMLSFGENGFIFNDIKINENPKNQKKRKFKTEIEYYQVGYLQIEFGSRIESVNGEFEVLPSIAIIFYDDMVIDNDGEVQYINPIRIISSQARSIEKSTDKNVDNFDPSGYIVEVSGDILKQMAIAETSVDPNEYY